MLVDQFGQFGAIAEEDGQIRCQNAVLDVAQHLFVIVVVELVEDVVALLLQDGHCLIEVMMFHGRRRVNRSQWGLCVQHELQ